MKSSHFVVASLISLASWQTALAQQNADTPAPNPSFGNGLSSEPLYAHLSGPGSWDFGLQTQLRLSRPRGLNTAYGLNEQTGAGSSSGLFLGYRLLPEHLSLQGAVRTGSGWDGRSVALDLGVHSRFSLTEHMHLGLGISASWMNDRASQQLLGDLGGSPQYALDSPTSGLRDIRAGVALNGNWTGSWSYALGANLGRYFGDPRTGAGLGLTGLNGRVFARTRFEF